MTNISSLFDNAELVVAAYAKLTDGNTALAENRVALSDTRGAGMPSTQVTKFSARYPDVVRQFDDTSPGGTNSGFNATLFSDRTGNLTLAIRGTDKLTGIANDSTADADIFLAGAAYDQIVAMTNWWLRARANTVQLVPQFRLADVPLHMRKSAWVLEQF